MKKLFACGLVLSLTLVLALSGCASGGGKGKNHAPVITSRANTLAVTTAPNLYSVTAYDANHDTLTYSLTTYPEGMTINPATGKIVWLPTLLDLGNHLVEVTVSDGSATASQKFAVRVSPLDNGVPFMRGFTLVSWWNDSYLQPPSDASLAQLRMDGVEWVSILVTWYQVDINSTVMSRSDLGTPSDEALVHAITTAHALGMNVVLKPHIDPLDGNWRGDIGFSNDADWATWFDNYNQFLGHYLALAEANHVEAVIIGTELMSTEGREADWRNTIAIARTEFSGLLTYDANHSSFFSVNWWDALDFIGISAYFPLTGFNSPSVDEIKTAWANHIRVLRAFAAYWDKDIVFTEIGYESRDGTNKTPWALLGSAPDLQEQADCYQASMESLYAEPWFKGMYWWAWSSDPSVDNNGFDIYNKPAETMLRQWYAGD